MNPTFLTAPIVILLRVASCVRAQAQTASGWMDDTSKWKTLGDWLIGVAFESVRRGTFKCKQEKTA
jgi:hypothetical protein